MTGVPAPIEEKEVDFPGESFSVPLTMTVEAYEAAKHNNYLSRVWEDLEIRAAEYLFSRIMDKGPFGVELRRMTWANAGSSDSEYLIHLAVKGSYSATRSIQIEYAEPAAPRVDLLPSGFDAERRLVFFCVHCGVPYFWGDRICEQCGAPLDYNENARKVFNDV